jgi:two-component system chemotaxis response regulator CheB
MQTRDVIVIGASMGGIETLSALVSQLPEDLPASILVAQHVSAASPGVLSHILDRRGPLPAVMAADGMPMQRGRIYVAPPDRHLLATRDGLRVVFGPRENRSRPAIDPLFRTAAVHYRSRVIGVILTGLLDDGAAGLHAIVRCGGLGVVQAPEDAEFPEMPTRAIERVQCARVVGIAEMAPLLDMLCREAAPESPPIPETLRLEARLTEGESKEEDWTKIPGREVNFTCPECRGAIREITDEGEPEARYRCRVGHTFTAREMAFGKAGEVERALWVAVQTLEERAAMLANLASADRRRGWTHTAESFEDRAEECRGHAARVRELITNLPEHMRQV